MNTAGFACEHTVAVLTWSLHPVPRVPARDSPGLGLVGGSATLHLGVVEDFGLPISAMIALGVILHRRAHRARPVPRRPVVQIGF